MTESRLTRTPIGNAKIEGMEADLGMSGSDYNIVTSIFFVPYILLGKSFLVVNCVTVVKTTR